MNIDSHILLPCPFCGQQPVADSTKNFHTVWCRNPECIEVRVCKFGDPEIAFGLWNRRAYSDWKKLQAENERLKNALRFYAEAENWKPQERKMLAPLGSNVTFDGGECAREALKGGEE